MSETEKPLNRGKKWSSEEVDQLLGELKQKQDVKKIAENHKRTEGGIMSRCGEIAYNMHIKGESVKKITKKTRLDKETIDEIIKKKELEMEKKKNAPKKKESLVITEIREEITNLKNRLLDMENTINELKKNKSK